MKTSVALLTFLLFCVAVAEVQQPVHNVRVRKRSISQDNKVAFGAALGDVGNIGPYRHPITLVYRDVYSNTGSYNQHTGIFTAPVRGIYYFSFTAYHLTTKPMGLTLMKNGEYTVIVWNHAVGNRFETATNGMTLQLEVGDHVYMRLWANTWINDNGNHHSTFTGFLLFSL